MLLLESGHAGVRDDAQVARRCSSVYLTHADLKTGKGNNYLSGRGALRLIESEGVRYDLKLGLMIDR